MSVEKLLIAENAESWKFFLLNEPAATNIPSKNVFKNKYYRLVLFMLICLLATATYIGWPEFQMLLYRMKAYHWLCAEANFQDGLSSGVLCEKQYRSVQVLYTIAQSSEFAFAVVAGACIDYIGPLRTVFIGFVMHLLGWIIVLGSSKAFNAYVVGMFLIGSSVNMLGFPCLDLEELFPKRRQLALSLIIACQTGSSLLPLLLVKILDALSNVSVFSLMWGYIGLIITPLFALSMFSFPYKRIHLIKNCFAHYDIEIDSPHESCGLDKTNCGASKNWVDEQSSGQILANNSDKKSRYKQLISEILSRTYLTFLIFYILAVLSQAYYPTAVRIEFSESVADFQSYFYPTQMIWGIILGFAVDYSGAILMCDILTIAFIIALSTALNPASIVQQYVSSVFFIITNSYIYTTKYIFISENYNKENFGFLVGLIGFTSGIFGYINIIFETFVSFSTMLKIYLGVQVIIVFLLLTLHKSLNKPMFSFLKLYKQ